mgnify:CR=1 FL=1
MAFDREARPARPARGNKRRKVCQFCAEKCECIDYKDAAKLRRSAEGLRRSSDPNGPALAAQADALAAELEEKRDAI